MNGQGRNAVVRSDGMPGVLASVEDREGYWGHGGSFPGYGTRGGVREDGRAAVDIAVTIQPAGKAAMEHGEDVVDTALCR
ncbi:hypothetical protein ABZW32_34440 [Streptomyces sp. NPDC004667]|uniref:hypothetical protein n=1 Tax=Streptomyces sp. NPDC004667 TaxID=3154285 RepID=UPI0033AB6EC3